MARLENMGLYDELRSLSKAANTKPQENEAILRELKSFQISTKQILPGSFFELEVHKNRVKELEKQLIEVQKRNAHYIEQQALFNLVRSDLQKYKEVFDMSKEFETMYSPFTPMHHYKKP